MHLSAMNVMQQAFVAACYGWLGDRTAAAAHVARISELEPEFNLEEFLATMHYANEADLQHLREGLSKAGVREDQLDPASRTSG
jgi:adenylate cyclase